MIPKTVSIVVAGREGRNTVSLTPGMSVNDLKAATGLPPDYAISIENGDFFLADEEDISSLVSEGEVLYASRKPTVGRMLVV